MSMLYRNLFRTGLKVGVLFTALAFNPVQETLAITPTATVAPLILSGRQSVRPAGTYSSGIAEIIKMLDAKVDAQVIVAYIQNSSIPYNPDAKELITLKEHGAPTEMLTTLLHRGDELRLQMAQGQSEVNPAPSPQAYDYAPSTSPAYPSDYPDSSYAPYPPAYYSYAYGWPLTYGPPVYFGGYRPDWYAHGGWYRRNRDAHHLGEGDLLNGATPAHPAPQARRWVSAPGRVHATPAGTYSGGSQGHSGGRAGGRGH